MKTTILIGLLAVASLSAQLPDDSLAPNFTATDINGNTYELYNLLEQGKTVILDFSTTWCGPCWSVKESGVLEDVYQDYGPQGSDETVVLFIESDPATTMDDLLGFTQESLGDWVTGVNHPIIDNHSIANKYQVSGYPQIISVCPNRRTTNLDQFQRVVYEEYENNIKSCPSEIYQEVKLLSDQRNACGSLEVQFQDFSFPRSKTIEWNFGDGSTSIERNPKYKFTEVGQYDVTMKIDNDWGTSSVTYVDHITVSEGTEKSTAKVGPTIGELNNGGYFRYGLHGLLFDVHTSMILNSVAMDAEFGGEVEIAVTAMDNGEIIALKQVVLEPGRQVVPLNIYLEKRDGYRISLNSPLDLYRSREGASYPYTVDNLVSIIGNTIGDSFAESVYYYFYDWTVREAGCNSSSSATRKDKQAIFLFPNPASNELIIKNINSDNSEIVIANLLGQAQMFKTTIQLNGLRLDISALQAGLYHLVVNDQIMKFVKL